MAVAERGVAVADKYNYEIGKLYDTAFFIVTRLFKKVMIERVYGRYINSDTGHNMRFFNEVDNNPIYIFESIIPACYCDSQQGAFLIRYIGDNINFDNATLNDVIVLLSDIEKSKDSFLSLYFPKLTKLQRQLLVKTNEVDMFIGAIKETNIPIGYHSEFLAYFLRYRERTLELIDTFKRVFLLVDDLHRDNQQHIQGIINSINDPANNVTEGLMRNFALGEEKPAVYSFSLLNPYVVHFKKKPLNHQFMVGGKFMDTLNRSDDYKHIRFGSFAKCVQTLAREEILDMFLAYEYLNVADIVKETGLAKNTVYAQIDDMLSEKIIVSVDIKSHSGMHYAINEEYLDRFIEYSRQRLIKYKELKTKGELKRYERKRKQRKDARI